MAAGFRTFSLSPAAGLGSDFFAALTVGDLGLLTVSSGRTDGAFDLLLVDGFSFEYTGLLAGEPGVLGVAGEEGADDIGGVVALELAILVRGFLAWRVRIFSSSSDDGYEPEFWRTCGRCSTNASAVFSRLTSCAKAPKEGARLHPIEGAEASLGGGTGAGTQNVSERRTRCTRGSGSGFPLLLLLSMEMDVDEREDRVRRMTRGCDDKDDSVLRVDELGVDGLIREGTSEGEDDLRLTWARVEREYGWKAGGVKFLSVR